jgi:uncharacterized protein YjiS (DUF1127 family)
MAYTTYTTGRSADVLTGAQDLVAQLLAAASHRRQARRTRAALVALTDYQLEDIGLSRADIEIIANRRH